MSFKEIKRKENIHNYRRHIHRCMCLPFLVFLISSYGFELLSGIISLLQYSSISSPPLCYCYIYFYVYHKPNNCTSFLCNCISNQVRKEMTIYIYTVFYNYNYICNCLYHSVPLCRFEFPFGVTSFQPVKL